jgi:hypothetical protein
MVGFELKN